MIDERFMYLAVLLIVWGAYAYIKDMYQSDTRPNLVTWFLWSVAPMIAFAAQLEAGVGPAAFLTLMVGLCPLAVFIAGLKKGQFRPSRFDLICGGASVAALILWQLTGSGAVAVALSITADGLAATPTLIKAYKDPRSESPFLFMLFAISAAITLLTLSTWSLEASGFSLYILILYVTLFGLVKFQPGKSVGHPDRSDGQAAETS
ncbi:MAG TPA: hypothetical protein VK694_01860 [Verrucomicrobiae bacterium]|nr:hypothetical protein [Verrucomicrobiae bacterium]